MQPEFEERVDIAIIDLSVPAGREAASAYDFAGMKHGLVALRADGTVARILPGHQFGGKEVRAVVEELLR
jgi:hypothetical protein